jgi:hypothetical protein
MSARCPRLLALAKRREEGGGRRRGFIPFRRAKEKEKIERKKDVWGELFN